MNLCLYLSQCVSMYFINAIWLHCIMVFKRFADTSAASCWGKDYVCASFGQMTLRTQWKVFNIQIGSVKFYSWGKWAGKAQTFIMCDIMSHYGEPWGPVSTVNFSSWVNVTVDPVFHSCVRVHFTHHCTDVWSITGAFLGLIRADVNLLGFIRSLMKHFAPEAVEERGKCF